MENVFSDSIYLIFDFISTFDEEVKMLAIKHFYLRIKILIYLKNFQSHLILGFL